MIGLFDSGLGGLTVAKALIQAYPHLDLLYLGDTARAPYGSKGKEHIEQFSIENTQWLIDHGATVIGIACNTASVAASETLKQRFPSLTIVNVIDPVIEEIRRREPKSVAILCTRGTKASGVYEQKITTVCPQTKVTTIACPLFVPLVEEGLADSDIALMVAKRYLQPLIDNPPEYLVLGCTHYPFLERKITCLLPSTIILNGPELFVQSLRTPLVPLLRGGERLNQKYFFTDLPEHTKVLAIKWIGCGEDQIQKT